MVDQVEDHFLGNFGGLITWMNAEIGPQRVWVPGAISHFHTYHSLAVFSLASYLLNG